MNCPRCHTDIAGLPSCYRCGHQVRAIVDRNQKPRARRIAATSREAYASHAPEELTQQQQRILDALRRAPAGLIRDELVDAANLQIQTVTPTVLALKRKGLIEETRTRRKTRTGRDAYVLIAITTPERQEPLL